MGICYHCAKSFTSNIIGNPLNHSEVGMIIPILQMRNLSLGEQK